MSLNSVLKSIIASADSTTTALSQIESKVDSPELPELVIELMNKTGLSIPEGVSLMDLKNNTMLSYINNLALIILSRLEQTKTNDPKKVLEVKERAIEGSITQRIVMERGVKGLEKKLQYQLDKMVRNYNKMEKDSSTDALEKKLNKNKKSNRGETTSDGEEKEDSDSENDSDEDSEAEDELNYKPDASALVESLKNSKDSKSSSSKSSKSKDSSEGAAATTEKYRPPKIAAALPPQEFRETSNKRKNTAKLQSMEEYLMETGDAPMSEASIGSTIIDGGRGGVKTQRDRKKEQEIQRYEESNFTRLSNAASKKDKRTEKQRQQDTFFGEDWGIFNNKRDDYSNSAKRSNPKSAWDRAKKRRTN